MREEACLSDQAESYARAAAEYGLTDALSDLAASREAADDKEHAAELWKTADAYGHPEALANIARLRYEAHDIEGAARTALEALDRGDAAYSYRSSDTVWTRLWPHGIEPDSTPTSPPDQILAGTHDSTPDPKAWPIH